MVRTVEKIFSNVYGPVKILRSVSAYSLMYSFVTHLLESGIDMRYIQEILGHRSSKTSEIYAHASNEDIDRFENNY